jgi:Cytochrome C oxidase, cbb3-type, subunit III
VTKQTVTVNPNPTLFRSWHWQRERSEEGAGGRLRLVELPRKVILEASSPLTEEDRGEGELIWPPHSNSLPPEDREPASVHRSTGEKLCRIKIKNLALLILIGLLWIGCGRNERMDLLYAQRCLSCHGPSGRGDGPVAASLPARIPDFRETVEKKSTPQIRRAIAEGRGIMPAFGPALRQAEITDMVQMVRFLSREGRDLSWWEKYDVLVVAHCNVPWELVLGYDEPPEKKP